jgi:hypothetical protein
MVSVLSAEEVPCTDANLAKSDLNDTNTADDHGAPRTKYWCYWATVAHEMYHRNEWLSFYGGELGRAISDCEAMMVDIDCENSSTTTCGGAYSMKINEINEKFEKAFRNAWDSMDNPDTPLLNEAEQRAYEVSYGIEQPISAALPEGCSP